MIRLLVGRSRKGKSRYMIDKMGQDLREKKENMIYMVPDQFTLEAERQIISGLKLPGLFEIQVLSFRRLLHMLRLELGGCAKQDLNTVGKAIVTNQVLYDYDGELELYQKAYHNSTFSYSLSKVITECKQFGVAPDFFEGVNFGGKLGKKCRDIGMLYQGYQKYCEGRTDYEDVIDEIIEKVPESKLLRGATIYVDSFDVFTKQAFSLMNEMQKTAESITVSVCTDLKNDFLFSMTGGTYQELMALDGEKEVINLNANRYCQNNIGHLEKYLYEEEWESAPVADGSVELFTFMDPISEIEHLTAAILQKKEEGMAYRDMAVICNNLEGYGRLCEQSFLQNGIPCYLDQKYNLLSSSLAQFILNLLKTCMRLDMTTYLMTIKQGYYELPEEQVERYENFILAHGIKRIFAPMEEEELESVRQAANFVPLKNKLQKAKTCKQLCQAVIHHTEALGIEPKSELEAEYYDKLMEILESMENICKDREMELPLFIDMLETGLEAQEVGTLPQRTDNLLIGDISRSKLHEVRAVFIIAAAAELVPKTTRQESLLTDTDRKLLKNEEMKIGRDSADIISLERLLTYKMISKPQEYLWMSCSLRTLHGEEQRISPLFERIKELVPGVTFLEEARDRETLDKNLLASQNLARKGLLLAIRQSRQSDFWAGVYHYFRERDDRLLRSALQQRDYDLWISPRQAQSLYGNKNMSATRLEEYYSCPFKQFVHYGLRPVPKQLYRIDSLNTGNLFHEILDDFSKKLVSQQTLDKEESLKTVERMVEEKLLTYGEGIFADNNVNRLMAERVSQISRLAVRNMLLHLEKDNFQIWDSEVAFGMNGVPPIQIELENGETAQLTGKIDRVDMSEENTIRIIDYKSGGSKLDYDDIYYGLKLQLLIYLDAAKQQIKRQKGMDISPGGMYYMRLNPKYQSVDCKEDIATDAEKLLAKALDVNGIVLKDVNVKKGKTLSPQQIDEVLSFGQEQAKHAITQIYHGNINIKPKKSTSHDSCAFCQYLTICNRSEEAREYLSPKTIDDIGKGEENGGVE